MKAIHDASCCWCDGKGCVLDGFGEFSTCPACHGRGSLSPPKQDNSDLWLVFIALPLALAALIIAGATL